MSQMSIGRGLGWGLGGLILGLVIARNVFFAMDAPGGGGISGFGIGVPEIIIVVFIAFWALLIGGVLWGLGRRFVWGGRGYSGRMEDLPADFDDWHRRAHERMREAAPADDSGRRG